jgi:lysozyme family protein
MSLHNKFAESLKRTLISEGVVDNQNGNVDHPDDEGGRTGAGILQTEYDKWRAKRRQASRDVWQMSREERDQIYWENYWIPMNCSDFPLAVAYMAFDTAVLHGVNFAKPALQRALGVKDDGIIGPITVMAANSKNPRDIMHNLRDERWARMQSRPSFPTFKKGWKKRLDDVERNAEDLIRLAIIR